jgi:hypothetical protein
MRWFKKMVQAISRSLYAFLEIADIPRLKDRKVSDDSARKRK